MTNALPDISISWSGYPKQILLIRFKLGSGVSQSIFDELLRFMDAFIKVGSHGGFVRERTHPTDGNLSLISQGQSDFENPGFELEAKGLDIRSFQVLRNLAEGFSNKVHPIQGIVVEDQTPNQRIQTITLPELTWEDAHDLYPPQSTLVRIPIDEEDPFDYQKNRRCLVEFGQPTNHELFDRLINHIDEWVTLMEAGAFSPPARPASEADVWRDTLAVYDEYSVELVFSVFDACEEGWKVLINSLEHFSATVAPIALVTLE